MSTQRFKPVYLAILAVCFTVSSLQAQTTRHVPGTYATIQAAIDAAVAGDEVVVAPGLYYENVDFKGKAIAVVSQFYHTGDRRYIAQTIIDGSRPANVNRASVVTFQTNETELSILSGFTLQGGKGFYGKFGPYCGGGVLVDGCSPSLRNLVLRDNALKSSNGSGAGMFIWGGAPMLEDVEVLDSRVGGGIDIFNVIAPQKEILKNVRVLRSRDSYGIYIASSRFKARNITAEDCRGPMSVGLFLIHASIDIDGAQIIGNKRGVDMRACENIRMQNAVVANSVLDGGISCTTTTVSLINTTVAGNRLSNHYGGAGLFATDTANTITLVNAIFYDNIWRELSTGIERPSTISFLNDTSRLVVAYSDIQGGQAGLNFFDGQQGHIKVSWLAGNIDAPPAFFKPERNDFHLASQSPARGTGTASFAFKGTTYVDLPPDAYEGSAPDMGAYAAHPAYLKADFTADRIKGNTPLTVSFTQQAYAQQAAAPDTWTWDFGDGTTGSGDHPQHLYAAAGIYTVSMTASNGTLTESIIKNSLIRVLDSDTLYVATTGVNAVGRGSKQQPFKTVQYGIDRATDNDVLLLADGIYKERINFHGKNVLVASYYVVDSAQGHINGAPRLERVTIASNRVVNTSFYGGGIYMESAQPTLRDVRLISNKAHSGGGLYVGYQSEPNVQGELWAENNEAWSAGGGVNISSNNPTLSNLRVFGNKAEEGAGIYIYSTGIVSHSVVAGNQASQNGGGIFYSVSHGARLDHMTVYNNTSAAGKDGLCITFSDVSISNSIIWNNPIRILYGSSTATATYSNIEGGWPGTGNLNRDPVFVNTASGDYSLDYTSPCIDAGDPAANPDPNGTITDIGAFYFDKPIIVRPTAPETMVMPEDGEKQISVLQFIVKNTGLDWPGSYSIQIEQGDHYTVENGATIKPDPDFSGTLRVTAVISRTPAASSNGRSVDGSQRYEFEVAVTPVNDPPVIVSQKPLSVDAQALLTPSLSDLMIKDPDNDVADMHLTILNGDNYTVEGAGQTAIRPVETFGGMLPVQIQVSDGEASSAPFSLQVEVLLVTATVPDPEHQIRAYPNPAREAIYLSYGQSTPVLSADLITLDSKTAGTAQTVSTHEKVVPVSHLSPGLYLLRIQTPNGVVWKKVTIVK